ncbi:MAG: alcohol dehydrogenase catalytic domain-containing protein [Actinomycetota bacterium]|nr:alcohol dehydrogenase catalytic domain-containing protein [Actinomycetota bacterium]
MKAVVLESLAPIEKGPLRLRDVERPSPGPGQVLLKVAACGVCRSNLHMIEGEWAGGGTPAFTPIIPGHEVVGTVAEIGTGVEHLAVGDRVGVQPLWSTCGFCEFCVSGLDHLCQSKHITGETVDGGYAEFMLATERHTYILPDELRFEDAAPLFCPGITAFGSVAKARLAPGKKVAVFGVGGVGHLVLQMAGLTGADVFAVSRGRQHLELGEELGATGIDALAGDPAEALNRRGGVDASIVFAPSDAVVDQAIRATRPGGVIVIGVNAKVGPLPFATEKSVVGSLLGTRQQMREVLALAAAGKISAQCQPFALEDATEALTALKNGQVRARAVLVV